MRRLHLVARCALLVAICLLTACAATIANSGTAATSPVAARPAGVTSLTIWHSWSGAQLEALNFLARDYEQSHPDVRISLQAQPRSDMIRRYSQSVADGAAPQLLIVMGRYIGDLAARQYIAPLTNTFEPGDLEPLMPSALASGQVGDQLYGVPLMFDTLALFYDKRRVAQPPATFDQAVALNTAQRAEPVETRPWSLGYYLSLETTLPYLSAFDGALFDAQRQPVFATQRRTATEQWLQWLSTLQANENLRALPDYNAVDAAVQQGRVLSVIDWSQRRSNYAQLWGSAAAVGTAALPAIDPAKPPQPSLLTEVISINTVIAPDQRAAAEDFLRYLIGQAAQQNLWTRGQVLPVHQQAALSPEAAPFREIGLQASIQPSDLYTAAVWTPLNDMVRNVLLNTATPSEALDAASTALQSASP